MKTQILILIGLLISPVVFAYRGSLEDIQRDAEARDAKIVAEARTMKAKKVKGKTYGIEKRTTFQSTPDSIAKSQVVKGICHCARNRLRSKNELADYKAHGEPNSDDRAPAADKIQYLEGIVRRLDNEFGGWSEVFIKAFGRPVEAKDCEDVP